MEINPKCRKCYKIETNTGIQGFLLECRKCKTWVHPGCHIPNITSAAIRAMITVSDRLRGSPGSLEAWECSTCNIPETIDLTLDSDSDDDIQVVEPPPATSKQSAFRPYTHSPYVETLVKNREATNKAYLRALFPPTSIRNEHQLLFTPETKPNPLTQWLSLPTIAPNPSSQKRARKPLAKLSLSMATSRLTIVGNSAEWKDA